MVSEPASEWRTGAPLYRDIANALEREIAEGRWKPGAQIPTEPELERRFGASRGTLRMAIAELVQKGLLYRRSGRGTFVLGPSFDGMMRYFRYERSESASPLVPEVVVLAQETIGADDATASALQVAPGDAVPYVRRLRRHDGEAFHLIDSYFSPRIWPKIEAVDFAAYPLYDRFTAYDLYIVGADEYLSAGIAAEEHARLLGVPVGSAVIHLERLAFTFEKEPVEYRRGVGRGDHFRYHVRLR